MSFREKIHWVAFVTMTLAFGWYFLRYPWQIADGRAGLAATAGMLVPVTIAIIAAMTVATALLAIRSPADVDLTEDERDRMFHRRGTHLAYYPLVLGVWATIVLIFWGAQPGLLLNLLLAAVVCAELVRIGSQILFYRRGY
ncbi:MAG: hypothetical protein DI569_03070 [Sphingopyxis macrogoltabida]|uniref:Uncharacterized protein n=1 Tax=Sphingopyxis macrogoltabida TaxID=33050 RepID=A0A2W5L3W6_SPHMC|nr:MAG: hypothetical protein DI569_03070 [Sphingopyxis macrogoltabida]